MTAVALAVMAVVTPARIEGGTKVVDEEEARAFVAPGLRFGSRSQELSLTLGAVRITRHVMTEQPGQPPDRRPGGETFTMGARVDFVASHWSPAAVHGLGYVSFGGWGWEWFPFGLELAGGYGGGSGIGYGIAEASYFIGISSRLELSITGRATLGSVRPDWFSNWVVGARYGFDFVNYAKRTVTTEITER